MRRPMRIKARRGRPSVTRSSSGEGSPQVSPPRLRQSFQERSCLMARLYEGGVISLDALQAGYKFRRLHRFYLTVLGTPSYARTCLGRLSPVSLPRVSPRRTPGEETRLLWEWQSALQALRPFGGRGERLLQRILEDKACFYTSNDLALLKEVLSALAETFANFL